MLRQCHVEMTGKALYIDGTGEKLSQDHVVLTKPPSAHVTAAFLLQ